MKFHLVQECKDGQWVPATISVKAGGRWLTPYAIYADARQAAEDAHRRQLAYEEAGGDDIAFMTITLSKANCHVDSTGFWRVGLPLPKRASQ